MTRRMTLAEQVKTWRGTLSAREATAKLGMPQRTLEGIEQGRPFRYEQLLRLALSATVLIPGSSNEERYLMMRTD